MAATAISKMRSDTPVAVAYETFLVDFDVDITILITPSVIKSIDHVEVTPMNAAAAASDAFLTTFQPGDATVTLTSVATALFLVTVFGRRA